MLAWNCRDFKLGGTALIPIGDDHDEQRATLPLVTYALIGLNVLVFVMQQQGGEAFLRTWAFVPANFIANPAANFITIFSAMFMHANLVHILGNMAYLWSFGDNIEDRYGPLGFLLFYLVAGIAATIAQTVFNPASVIPNVGASGAIAGVIGGYLVLFPNGRIKLMTRGGIIFVPALLAIGVWIALQFISLAGSMSSTADTGGVAYMAHIGGFFTGAALALIFGGRR
jgi:membrane associated rhomboid family serine protease